MKKCWICKRNEKELEEYSEAEELIVMHENEMLGNFGLVTGKEDEFYICGFCKTIMEEVFVNWWFRNMKDIEIKSKLIMKGDE